MPAALSPALALDYVRELSADVRAVLVLDAATGARLAGEEGLVASARALLAASPAAELEVATPAGVACAVRDGRHALVAVCGPLALAGIVRSDLRAALAALSGAPAAPPPADAPAAARAGLVGAAEALFSTLERVIGPTSSPGKVRK